jgi:hypothetical protein
MAVASQEGWPADSVVRSASLAGSACCSISGVSDGWASSVGFAPRGNRLPGYPAYRCRGRRLAVSGRQTQGAAKPIHKMKLLYEKYGGGIDEGRLETLDARRPRHGVRRQGHLRTI